MLGFFTILILFLFITIYLFKTGSIQDKFVQGLTERVKKVYNTDISFDSYELSFENGILLKNILINDHYSDTLFYAKSLKTNLISIDKLSERQIMIDNLHLDGLIINVKKYPIDKINSFQFFLNLINSQKDSIKVSPIISISSFKIDNGEIRLPNNTNSFKIFKMKSSNFIAGPDFIETSFVDGEFKILKFNPFSFKSNFLKYLGCSFSVNDYVLVSDFGELIGDLDYQTSSLSLFNDFEKSRIKSKIKILNFQPSKTGLKIDSTFIVSAKLDLFGTLDSINVKNVIIDSGFSKFNGELNVFNVFSKKINQFSGYVVGENIQMSELNNVLQKSIPQLDYLNNEKIKNFNFKGIYSSEKFKLNIDLDSNFGNFKIKLNKNITDKKNNSILVDIKNLNLSKINKSMPDGAFSGNLNLLLKDSISEWDISKGYFVQKDIIPIQFTLKGLGDFKKGNILWSAIDGMNVSPSIIEYDFSTELNKLSSVINLETYDLSNINKKIGGGKAILSGVFKSKIEGKLLDDSSIILTVQDLKINHKDGVLKSSDFYLNSFNNNGLRNFTIINSSWLSGEAIGKFDISKIGLLINNVFSETFPIIPKLKLDKPQELNFNFTLSKNFVNVLNTDIQSTEDFKLVGYLNNDKYKSYFDIEVPFFEYQNFFAQDLRININNKSSNRDSNLTINKVIYKNSNFGEFFLGSKTKNNKLLINVQLKSLIDNGNEFNINFDVKKSKKNINVFDLNDSSIFFNGQNWDIKKLYNESIIYNYKNNSINVSDFQLISGDSKVKINGFYNNLSNFNVNIDFQNNNLNQFLKQIENFKIEGRFDSTLKISKTPYDYSLTGMFKSNDLHVNKNLVGKLDLNIEGNTKLNSYVLDWNILNNNTKTFSGKGNFILDKSPKLNFDISFSKFDISFLSQLGKKSLSNIYGYLNGDLKIWGDTSNIQNIGLLSLTNSGFTIPYLNTNYTLSNKTKINLNDNFLEFIPTKLFDPLFNTKANLKAKFSHLNFKEWDMDLNVNSKGVLLLNKKETSDALFYGKGFLSGDISMKGPIKNLKLQLIGLTAPGTSIKIPWKDTQEISDISFITFIDKKSKINIREKKQIKPLINQVTGLEMYFELDINNDASVEIVIDQSSGSYLSGKGVGRLLMESNTKNKFNIWGDFTTSNGVYNFKNLGLLDKKFDLESGGTIVWNGDPVGAQMDLKALYQVPGGANPAILLDNPGFNKKIPTEVGIHLQGSLLKPDNPIFEIFFPNTSGTVVSEINYRLSDPQRSQLQAISLLSQGMFINEVSLSVDGITNNLYEKASDILTSILGDSDEKLKIGINYLQGDKNNELDIFSEDRLGLTLSTQISDKILINGKIGVPIGGVNETLIVGDVQIDFILNEDGSLKAKVFNKENEFRYIGDKLGYTQGMGLSYNVDFNTFKDLIKKIIEQVQ